MPKKKEKTLDPPMYLIKGQLRRLFVRSELYIQARDRALLETKGVRGGKQFACSNCGLPFGSGKVIVDHINPVIEIGKAVKDYDLNTLVSRMWCDIDNLCVLCISCHDEKSATERRLRKRYKQRGGRE